ncbi:hypothetical protein ABGB12_34915 [Actinocorallia sp. B10E7]|uniref:hypothetical protein n=1 Tax=Actinocorallia sp. B10E7 TaxID=3153558 RepID=UPI00325EFAEE
MGELIEEIEALSGQTPGSDSSAPGRERKTADLVDKVMWAADKVLQLAREHKGLVTSQGDPKSVKTVASQYTNPDPCDDDRDSATGQPYARPQTLPDGTADPDG